MSQYNNHNTVSSKLQQLFESTQNKDDLFMVQQIATSPLRPVDPIHVKNHIMNPLTGEPYDGLVLFGEFAAIDVLNTNNRFYSKENYIDFVEYLKAEVFSPKGVYGEYEHPKGYPVDGKNVTHKILDLWYDETDNKVYGYVMLLNTAKAQPAWEIIKSGGQLGISARGGGSEVAQSDGTLKAMLSLLITFDLVYHPGFSTSLLSYQEPKFLYESSDGTMKPKKLKSQQSAKQVAEDEEKMQQTNPQSKQKQKKLQNAVDKQLNENSNSLSNAEKYIKRL